MNVCKSFKFKLQLKRVFHWNGILSIWLKYWIDEAIQFIWMNHNPWLWKFCPFSLGYQIQVDIKKILIHSGPKIEPFSKVNYTPFKMWNWCACSASSYLFLAFLFGRYVSVMRYIRFGASTKYKYNAFGYYL